MKAHRAALALAVVTASLGLSAPGAADDTPVEDSCTLHPTHVVNPGCVPAVTSELQQPGRSYPDISPDVQDVLLQRPFVQDPETQMFVPGRMHIWFDTWAQNLGTVPVQLTVEEIQSTSSSTVTQCVAWTLRVCRERAEVGGFSWHEEHRHFHYDDFAAYQLRRLAADGRPDYSDAGLIAISDKVSYCMVDSFLLDPTKPSPPTYVGCSNVQQGISPGWADIYDATMPGQQLPVEGLPDGRYALIVAMNHSGRLFETDYSNNLVEITVEISGDGTAVAIVSRHHP